MRGYGLGRKPTSKPSLGHFSVGQLWEEMSCAHIVKRHFSRGKRVRRVEQGERRSHSTWQISESHDWEKS